MKKIVSILSALLLFTATTQTLGMQKSVAEATIQTVDDIDSGIELQPYNEETYKTLSTGVTDLGIERRLNTRKKIFTFTMDQLYTNKTSIETDIKKIRANGDNDAPYTASLYKALGVPGITNTIESTEDCNTFYNKMKARTSPEKTTLLKDPKIIENLFDCAQLDGKPELRYTGSTFKTRYDIFPLDIDSSVYKFVNGIQKYLELVWGYAKPAGTIDSEASDILAKITAIEKLFTESGRQTPDYITTILGELKTAATDIKNYAADKAATPSKLSKENLIKVKRMVYKNLPEKIKKNEWYNVTTMAPFGSDTRQMINPHYDNIKSKNPPYAEIEKLYNNRPKGITKTLSTWVMTALAKIGDIKDDQKTISMPFGQDMIINIKKYKSKNFSVTEAEFPA